MELSGDYALTRYLRADLTLYRNKLDGLLSLAGNRWVNSGGVETRGAEAQLEYARGSLKTYLNYTFQDSEDEAGAGLAEIARDSSGAGVLYAFSRKVKLDLKVRYFGGRKNPKTIAATGSGYVGRAIVTDAALSFLEMRNLNVQLMAKNLFNEKYFHTSNRPPDRYRQAQRQLLIQVGYAFGI